MNDTHKTQKQPVDELADLHSLRSQLAEANRRIADLEEALRAAQEDERRFRRLFEQTPIAYQSLDEDGCLIEVNRAWLDMLGYAKEDVLGRPFAEFLAPGLEERFVKRFERFKTEGEAHDVEWEVVRQDGAHLLVSLDGVISYDQHGNVQQTHCTTRDITERVRSEAERARVEEALRESEARARALMNATTDSACLMEPDGILVALNEETARRLGETADDLVGRNVYDLLPPDVAQRRKAQVEKLLRAGQAIRFKDTRAGRIIDSSMHPVFNPQGEIVQIAIFGRDVTEHVRSEEEYARAEEALRESEIRYRTVADFTYDWEYWLNEENTLHYVSPSCERITGYRVEQFLDSPQLLSQIVLPQDREIWERHYQKHSVLSDPAVIQFRIKRQDGEIRWIEHACQPVATEQDAFLGIRASNRDITRRKQAEEALRAAKESLEKERDLLQQVMNGARNIHLVYLDRDFNFARVNQAYAATCGYEPEEMIGKNHFVLYPHPENEAIFTRVRDTGIPFETKDRPFTFPDQPERGVTYWDWSLMPVKESDGTVIGLIFSLVETTARKRAEEALRESQANLSALIESTDDIIVSRDRQGRAIAFNSGFARIVQRLFGIEARPGVRTTDYLPEAQQVHWEDTLEKVLSGASHQEEFAWKFDNETWYYELSLKPIWIEGEIIGSAEFTRDITKHKQMEETLRESERELQLTLDATTDGIWKWNFKTDELYFSPRYYTMLGYEPNEFPASFESWRDLIHPDDWEAALSTAQIYLATKPDRYENQFRLRTKDGDYRCIHATAQVVEWDDDGHAVRMIGNHQDITERVRFEQARARAEEALRLDEARLEALLRLTHMTEASLEQLAGFALEEAIKLTRSEIGFLGFMDPDETMMHLHAWSKETMAQCSIEERPLHFSIAEAGIWGDAVRQRKPLVVNDYSASDLDKKGYPEGHVPLSRLLTIPVFEGQRIVAVAAVANKAAAYNASDVRQLTLLMDGMWRIVRHRQAEEALRQRNRQLTLLNHAGRALGASLDPGQVLTSLLEELWRMMDVTACSVWLLDPTTGELVCEHATGPKSEIVRGWRLAPGQGIAGWVAQHGKSLVTPDVQTDERYFEDIGQQTGLALRSLLTVPLQTRSGVIGAIQAVDTEADRFDEASLQLLESLATAAAVAINNARLFEEVQSSQERLQVLSQRLVDAQETERRRIARELHDVIGQALTAVKINLQSAQRLLDSPEPEACDPRVEQSLAGVVENVEQTLQQVRDLSTELRPSLLDDLGLAPALRWYLDRQAQQVGFSAQFAADPALERRLPPHLEIACFRVAQEALTNVARHAQAQWVTLQIREQDEELALRITDDGVGFDVGQVLQEAAHGASLGLLSMQERAALVGGTIEIASAPAQGTAIRVRLPLAPISQAEEQLR